MYTSIAAINSATDLKTRRGTVITQHRTGKALMTKGRFWIWGLIVDLALHKDLSKAEVKELPELSFRHSRPENL
jgi:hypothetical protein